ncbi:MAG: branched-chain amino acid ABC transporter permease [Candidatus Lambdaproteobacteria bacterium]|nr:branched-chain amino acid ABC transporter permease [Candidatus Lambdaproteobacteria bacterium]
MEQAEIRRVYLLGAFIVAAFATPFAVGAWSGNIFYDRQWLMDLITVCLNGLLQGGVYAMYGVGLTLIFGVMRIINVAHGEIVMLGAYLTWVLFNAPEYLGLGWHLDPLLTMVITLPIAFALGFAIQKVLLNAVVGGPELTPLLITFGVGIAMINLVEWIFTTDYHTIPYQPDAFHITETIFVGKNKIISFAMALAISLGVFLFLKLHRLGKAIRATAQNPEVAMVCGIDVQRIYLVTFGLGAALASAGGALVSIQFGFNPETGVQYTVVAFAIIVLGGRGHYLGAMLGAVLLAVLENLVSFMVPNGSAMVEMAAYTMIVGVLLIRPQGLLGVKET